MSKLFFIIGCGCGGSRQIAMIRTLTEPGRKYGMGMLFEGICCFFNFIIIIIIIDNSFLSEMCISHRWFSFFLWLCKVCARFSFYTVIIGLNVEVSLL